MRRSKNWEASRLYDSPMCMLQASEMMGDLTERKCEPGADAFSELGSHWEVGGW